MTPTNDILTVLVGSRAHGLHDEDSDYDWRGVFVNPTRDLFKVFPDKKQTSWEEGQEDNTKWEIQRFMQLAVKCNPTILEVFAAPVKDGTATVWGTALRELFPYVWEPIAVKNAFIGYGLNQRKKFFDDKDGRKDKFATAYARTLLQAYHLLTSRILPVDMTNIPGFEMLKRFRNGDYKHGEVIDFCLFYQGLVEDVAASCKHKPNPEKVDEFMMSLRTYFLS
jgi:hypothetical protein